MFCQRSGPYLSRSIGSSDDKRLFGMFRDWELVLAKESKAKEVLVKWISSWQSASRLICLFQNLSTSLFVSHSSLSLLCYPGGFQPCSSSCYCRSVQLVELLSPWSRIKSQTDRTLESYERGGQCFDTESKYPPLCYEIRWIKRWLTFGYTQASRMFCSQMSLRT